MTGQDTEEPKTKPHNLYILIGFAFYITIFGSLHKHTFQMQYRTTNCQIL